MAAASPTARNQFTLDLSAALEIASAATTSKTQKAQATIMGHWNTFCKSIGCDISLCDVVGRDQRLAHLLVYGMRYRLSGQTHNAVRSATVGKALAAVGKGISDLGQPDPRLDPTTGKLHPLLSSFLKSMEDDDDPQARAYPANLTILRAMPKALDMAHAEYGAFNSHVIDLVIVAFWWLLRPAEYLNTSTPEARSQAFLFKHIHFTIAGTVYNARTAPLNDSNLSSIEFASLEFDDQKNAVKGEQVGHKPTTDRFFCPCKALGRIALRMRRDSATLDDPIYRHYNRHPKHTRWFSVTPTHVTNALRHAAATLVEQTGIDHMKLTSRSLRPGGATALLCARVDKDAIMLLGRWKSDAMLRYLRIQAASHAHNYAQQMLDHGAFTFQPSSYSPSALPDQAPADVAALLAHEELYND